MIICAAVPKAAHVLLSMLTEILPVVKAGVVLLVQWNREGSQILWIDPRINISVYGVLKNWATSFRINVCTSINIAIYFISTQHHRSGSVIKTVGVLNVRILT